MFLILIAAVFGNLGQAQLKYEFCKKENFKHEYCSVQKKLFEHSKPSSKDYNFYMDHK